MGNPFFTAENAKAYGKAGRAKQIANGIRKPGYHKPQQSPTAELVDSRAREVLELIHEQIDETRAMLNNKEWMPCEHCKRSGIGPNERSKLLVALDRLLERERVWSQRAGPGQLRPEVQRKPTWQPRPAPPSFTPLAAPVSSPSQVPDSQQVESKQ